MERRGFLGAIIALISAPFVAKEVRAEDPAVPIQHRCKGCGKPFRWGYLRSGKLFRHQDKQIIDEQDRYWHEHCYAAFNVKKESVGEFFRALARLED